MNPATMFHSIDAATFSWAMDLTGRGTLVLALAGLAATLPRKLPASARHWLWFLGLTALPILPAFAMALPGWRALPAKPVGVSARTVELPRVETSALPHETNAGRDTQASRALESSPVVPLPYTSGTRVEAPGRPPAQPIKRASVFSALRWPRVALLVWLCGFLICLLPVLIGFVSLFLLARRTDRLRSATWEQATARVAKDLGLRRGVILLAGKPGAMPMTWGVWRPKLLLPAEASDWPNDRRRAVLAHELAHVRRHDCLTDLISRLICSAYWFNPFAWLALARTRDLRERACDDRVLASGADAPSYADHLLGVAASCAGRVMPTAVAMARPSKLRARLEAILDEDAGRRPVGRGRALALTLAVVAVTASLAMLRAADGPPATKPATTQSADEIVGDVLDSAGSPVAGAEVELGSQRLSADSDFGTFDMISRATTVADGSYRLPSLVRQPGHAYLIRATAAGYAYGSAAMISEGHFLDSARHQIIDHPSIILPPAARITGEVVDERGKPVAGATVVVHPASGVLTDAVGRFVFDKGAPSIYGLFSGSSLVAVRHPDFLRAETQPLGVMAGADTFVRIALDRGTLVRGTLTDAETGKPLKGYSVTAYDERAGRPRSFAHSDEKGEYEMRVPSRGALIRATAARGVGADDPNYYALPAQRRISAADGTTPATADFQFRRGLTIEGRVVLFDQRPVGPIHIEAKITGADSSSRDQKYSADGTFRIGRLKAGRYDIVITEAMDRGKELLRHPVDLINDRDINGLVIALPVGVTPVIPVEPSGVARYADGRPAANAQIRLIGEGEPMPYVGGYTLSDGSFKLRPVDPRQTYSLWIRDVTGTKGASALLGDAAQLRAPLHLMLVQGAEFSGRLTSFAGGKVAGRRISIVQVRRGPNDTESHRPLASTYTDEKGEYILAGFVPPAGVTNLVLEADSDMSRLGVSLSSRGYRDVEFPLGIRQTGFDFVETQTPSDSGHIQLTIRRRLLGEK